MTPIIRAATALSFLAVVSLVPAEDQPLKYPDTRRTDQVDLLHGIKVADPYRWLEEDVRKSKEVADWVAAENKVTSAYLQAIPERAAIQKRLTTLWNYEKMSAPTRTAGRYYFTRNNGLQNQNVLCVADTPDGTPRVILDPNTLSKDGTIAISAEAVSDDGKYLAYATSEAGSDWSTFHVLQLDTGKLLPDELKWVKFSEASWTRDGKGFFYSRFDAPASGATFQDVNLNQKVFYHRVGTNQAEDVLVYKRPDQPEWGFETTVSEDGRYLVISTWKGTDPRNRITYRDLDEPYGLPIDLIDTLDNEYSFLGNDGPVFYFKTDLDAPRARVLAIDIRHPERKNWKELIPQAKDNLTNITLVGNQFLAVYLKDAHSQVQTFALDGRPVRSVTLPGLGSVAGFAGKRTDSETFYTFESFATPPSVYRYDLLTGESKLFRRPKVSFDPDAYEVQQVFYSSKDGTRIPLFLTYRKAMKRDGTNPVLLYGYGGFNIPMTPTFGVSHIAWLEMGGVYAQACLRGGGEYGEDWHKAGKKAKKQTVFDDFIAAAEYLIADKITTSEKLAIQGGSNGGLLIGAVLTQRPELFGAALPAVGVMDMLRFHKFTAGRYWVDEYGSSDEEADFKAIHAYSPYHNLKKGVPYPATLITTADTDDRVVPGHSFKFAAQLQYCQGGPAPVLIRIETSAGHGAGKPTSKRIEEIADQWAFLVKNLQMKVKPKKEL
jgi:prolyl oligopeptidase